MARLDHTRDDPFADQVHYRDPRNDLVKRRPTRYQPIPYGGDDHCDDLYCPQGRYDDYDEDECSNCSNSSYSGYGSYAWDDRIENHCEGQGRSASHIDQHDRREIELY
jgi:hypothetical protein